MMPLAAEWLTLASVLVLGLFLGFLYDIYRIYRYLWRPSRWGSYLGDLGYWFLATLLTFGLLMHLNWAQIRAYVFIGIFVGLAIYFSFLGPRLRPLLLRLGLVLKSALQVLARLYVRTLLILLLPGRLLFLGRRRPPPA